MENQIIEHAITVIQPVWECALVLAGEYRKKCNREILTGDDFKYALKYSAMNLVGKHIGTLFPELEDEDEDEDEDEEDIETVDEDDEPFTRYVGDDKLMNDINESVDKWDEWQPFSPIEVMLKDAVNKND